MGSSLTVTPAADMPKLVGKQGKLIIVNLQNTALDKYAFMRVNAMCDDFMKLLAAEMQLQIEEFTLTRYIQFNLNKEFEMSFRGMDPRGVPFSFLKEVSVAFNKEKSYKALKGEPYKVSMEKKDSARIKFQFYGFLHEPDV